MYDNLDFSQYAFSPRTGYTCHIDELPIMHTTSVVATRWTPHLCSFRFVGPRICCELQNLIRYRFPADLETIWKYGKIYMLVDYLGCPILCHITLNDSYYEKSKNNQAD